MMSRSIRRLPLVLALGGLLLVAGCNSGEPFDYVRVSGKVAYDDDTLIPADTLVITFFPQSPPRDARTHPRPGMAVIDRSTGTFDSATSHLPGDGLVRGKHKVTINGLKSVPLPATILPPEYADPTKTPLEVDTAQTPFQIRVRKPT